MDIFKEVSELLAYLGERYRPAESEIILKETMKAYKKYKTKGKVKK